MKTAGSSYDRQKELRSQGCQKKALTRIDKETVKQRGETAMCRAGPQPQLRYYEERRPEAGEVVRCAEQILTGSSATMKTDSQEAKEKAPNRQKG